MGKKETRVNSTSQLINFSKKFTDYGAEDDMMADPDMERKGVEIDDAVGVAVVFDEEGQESDEEEGLEVRDKSDVKEEGGEGDKNGVTAADKNNGKVATLSFGVLKLACSDANELVNRVFQSYH